MSTDKVVPALPEVSSGAEWGSASIAEFHEKCIKDGIWCKLPLPSGATIIATRPPLAEWYTFGLLPQSLTGIAVTQASAAGLTEALIKEAVTNPETLKQMAGFVRDVIAWTIIRPRVVDRPTNKDEIAASKIPPQDLMFILEWVKELSPGVPVETESGVTSVEALRTFLDRGRHAPNVSPKPGRKNIRKATKRRVRSKR